MSNTLTIIESTRILIDRWISWYLDSNNRIPYFSWSILHVVIRVLFDFVLIIILFRYRDHPSGYLHSIAGLDENYTQLMFPLIPASIFPLESDLFRFFAHNSDPISRMEPLNNPNLAHPKSVNLLQFQLRSIQSFSSARPRLSFVHIFIFYFCT